ncbi:MAG: FHA domain-containing protein [Polyangiaceae bacterium]
MSSLRLEVATGATSTRSSMCCASGASTNELVLDDALLSSEHAPIVSGVDGFVLEDLGSTNHCGEFLPRPPDRDLGCRERMTLY